VTVTHSNDVTDGDVTHFNDVRNAFEVRDVTHSASVRNALNAARTISEPPAEPPPTEDSPEPAPSPSSPNDPGTEDGGGNAAHQEQRRSDAVEFLRALPSPWGVGRVTAQAMAPLLLQSLTDTGWNLDSALVAKLTENPGGVRSPHAVLPLRIADLPKRSQPAPRRSAIPDWCGQCAGGDPMAKTEPSMRWIDTADGATVPCPECSLQAHRTPAA
jgi:hypothetical protein